MKHLSQHDHEYHIYIDNQSSFRWDKNREIGINSIQKWIQYLESKWVDKIILPPTYEMAVMLDPRYQAIKSNNIANIYISYIRNYIAKYSIVGKLWFVWDAADMEFINIYIADILSDFVASGNQTGNKHFQSPFLIYKKQTPLRKYMLQHLSPTSHIINHTIQTDIRKIKSYNLDTLIPLNYAYFAADKSIKHWLWAKIKFHNIYHCDDLWNWLDANKSEYTCNIYITDNNNTLYSEKKWKWLLCRGKSIEWNIEII